MSLKIIGTGRGIPKKAVSNKDLTALVETSDEWITSRTGIQNRYVCTDESLTDLSEQATQKALANANMTIEDIDMIVCSTMSGDFIFPSLACALAERMEKSLPAYDINAACSGFVYALDLAQAYLDAGKAKNILIVCAEMMSTLVDWKDRATCVLFGDGAGACVVTAGNALKYINLTADGNTTSLYQACGTGNSPFATVKSEPGFLQMDGQAIFKFAVGMIESQAKLAAKSLDIDLDDIDYYLLHQANKRILDSARSRLKQPEEKFPVNVSNYGNTSSVSVIILLDELLEAGKIKKGDMILMSAFGGGLTTGTCIMKWE